MTGGKVKGRVLVADDDEQVRSVITRVLRSGGFEVDAVADGAEATKRLGQNSYDLVITDLMMPGVNGIGLLRLVRARDLDLPVVIVAGAPSVQTAMDAVEHGALRYLTKPFNPEEVVAVAEKGVALYQMAQVKRQLLQLTDTDRLSGDRAGLTVSFERALDQLWMAYQPIVSWTNRSLFAYEALMRSDEKTLPHPGAILHAAERLERLHELGQAVRGSVARMMAQVPNVQVFVNLHTYDLMDPEIFRSSSPLSQFSSRVVLEITERAALDRVEDVRSKVARLRDLGYRIAVDDLGAGYAGLTSFAQLDPDIVKLDMSLVRDIHRDPTRRALVLGLLSACRNLGVTVVAEGVEVKEELDVVHEAGAEFVQGYLFGKPAKELREPTFS